MPQAAGENGTHVGTQPLPSRVRIRPSMALRDHRHLLQLGKLSASDQLYMETPVTSLSTTVTYPNKCLHPSGFPTSHWLFTHLTSKGKLVPVCVPAGPATGLVRDKGTLGTGCHIDPESCTRSAGKRRATPSSPGRESGTSVPSRPVPSRPVPSRPPYR